MKTVPVTLRGDGTAIEYQLRLALDCKVLDFRLNAQTMVGFDDQACRLVSVRTGQALSDDLLIEKAEILSGDVLTVVRIAADTATIQSTHTAVSSTLNSTTISTPGSVPSSGGAAPSSPSAFSAYGAAQSTATPTGELLVPYKLILVRRGPKQTQWEYDVHLKKEYENSPRKFFEAYGGQEYQNLADFLRSILARELSPAEIDRLLYSWCEDISMGHRKTVMPIS
ncbi:MAG: hypothetical protein AAFY72_06910 [Cyanobacteria bacterium J06649_4]